MVRLKVINLYICSNIFINFNSTMVRLKVLHFVKQKLSNVFQFHYGTIKSLTLEKISALIFKNLANTKL